LTPPILTFALAYAKLGIHVFPIEPRGKRPVCNGGVLSASTNTGQLREWFRDPTLNIAIAAGASNLAIVDVDPRNGGSLEWEEPLPHTPMAMTGRGDGGQHHFFRAPDVPLKNGPISKGLDLKAGNGYVVCAPSTHECGGLYRWINSPAKVPFAPLPEWVIRLGTKAPESLPPPVPRPVGPSPLDRASRYLAVMEASVQGQGGSVACLKAAMSMVQGFALSDDEALYLMMNEFNPRCQPPWSLRDMTRKIKEAGRLAPRNGRSRGWLRNDK
jgi:hypothetical protein